METKSSDSSSTANSEEYEIVAKREEEPIMEGNEAEVKETMSECLALADTSMVNENVEDDTDHTIFHNICYLGASRMDEPKNERLIHGVMNEFNVLDDLQDEAGEQKTSINVILAVPRTSEGLVVLRDAESKKEITQFAICRIIFFARGSTGSKDQSCFAFTCAHTEHDESKKTFFQCHVFRCRVVEAVTKIFVSFAQAFKKKDLLEQPEGGALASSAAAGDECFLFEVSLEIKEKSESNNVYELVPRQKGIFKLRSNIDKKVIVSVQQISRNSCKLKVERCFGMLVSPGRNVRHADMQLLEHVTMATTPNNHEEDPEIVHVITGSWDPRETSFAVLNKETPTELNSVYLTIAADLVMSQVAEPVRFVVETKARILPQNERYWYYAKKSLVKQFNVRVKRREDKPDLFDVIGIDKSEEIELNHGNKLSLTLQLANLTASTWSSLKSPPATADGGDGGGDISPTITIEDDGEEPLLSGFGDVSKECTGSELENWGLVLQEWDRDNPKAYPKNLPFLVRNGVPETLRGEVWQRITGASVQQDEIIEAYRILITKESPDEKVIMRDIHRTFPAHEFFKEAGGIGQESLYRISKAYSVYDSEIGYCQGQSFLIASLLLQMPEEQAFGVLVKVMHDLGLRDMFRENFEQLQLRLYQLDRLIEANLTDLHVHFLECGLESHMYASQWFLTVFTAKFPLFLVFRVLDVFLLDGFDAIFQVALAILKVARKDLLNQDFEGLMKYFRVNIPKTYRSNDNAKHLMAVATSIKLKRLAKYQKEWLLIKEAERQREDPVVRLERENKKLLSDNIRLDTENDNLARELVNSKIEMRKDLDSMEDAKDYYEKELESTKGLWNEAIDERKRLEGETDSLKSLLKREVDKLDAEVAKKNKVISEYKTICSQLSIKLEKAQTASKTTSSEEGGENDRHLPTSTDPAVSTEVETLLERVKELEMELAQTKLALVETKCRNQELNHQLMIDSQQHQQPPPVESSQISNKKWFAKTLYSIKETAVASASSSLHRGQGTSPAGGITKSSSVDVLKSLPDQ